MALTSSTLRPGLLVSLKTSVVGNVKYRRNVIIPEHITKGGKSEAKWETERTIRDAAEYKAAVAIRLKARGIVERACAMSAFGMLCPEDDVDKLEKAITEAKKLVSEFNKGASLTQVGIYMITGRVAPDDAEAVRAINSEMTDLIKSMESGLETLDVKKVRDAASKAKKVGTMLSPKAAERIADAVKLARSAASKVVKAGENAAAAIDRATINKLATARTAFLDLDDAAVVEHIPETARAVDFEAAPRERFKEKVA